MSMHSKHYQIKQREKHEAAQIQKQVIKDQGAPIQPEVNLIRKTFDKYDFDKNGNISEKEFRLLCADMGYFLSDKEAKLDMKILDKDGNGEIGFDEFLSWWKREDRFKILQIPPEDLEVLQLITQDFNKFDRDSSGSIDINEFKQLHFELIRRGVTRRNLIQTLNELDQNKDGKIQFNEYVQWILRQDTTPLHVRLGVSQQYLQERRRSVTPAL